MKIAWRGGTPTSASASSLQRRRLPPSQVSLGRHQCSQAPPGTPFHGAFGCADFQDEVEREMARQRELINAMLKCVGLVWGGCWAYRRFTFKHACLLRPP